MRRIAVLSLIALLVLPASGQAQDQVIGHVSKKAYQGATGERVTGSREQLYYRTDVWSDQTVRTPRSGETTLRMLDETKLQVGPESEVTLDGFVYDPGRQAGDMAISFGTGVFRFITGEMQNKDGFSLATPIAQLAIRGTDFIVAYSANPVLLELAVLDGVVEIIPNGGGGPATVTAGQSATLGGAAESPAVAQGSGGLRNRPGMGNNPY